MQRFAYNFYTDCLHAKKKKKKKKDLSKEDLCPVITSVVCTIKCSGDPLINSAMTLSLKIELS